MAEPLRAGAEKLLADLRKRGFTAEVAEGKLWVRPYRRLTAAQRAAITSRRHDLIVLLVNPPIESGLCPHCRKNKSSCPPYGWCGPCCEETWAQPGPIGRRS